MNTPICSFVEKYAESESVRMHMPGHKGHGAEHYSRDITEIDGADSLYEANGIIMESERNAGELFGADTFYSTEGSSLAIRAMLYLAVIYAKERSRSARILAARCAHKTFVGAAAMLGINVDWIYKEDSYLSCRLTAEDVATGLDSCDELPIAVYVTSPDYLGITSDIEGIARVCRERDVLLIVDNAHGAYLKFLPVSRHPIDLGADMCCDSAHKTLSVLTGGAYLHISKKAPAVLAERARGALSLFGSTSPSYLILASLDAANLALSLGYREALASVTERIGDIKARLISHGYTLVGDEPMKLTVYTKPYGYRGDDFARLLCEGGIIPEFSDPDFTVLMPSVDTDGAELSRLLDVMLSVPRLGAIEELPPRLSLPKTVTSIREAVLSPSEVLPVSDCVGRVLSQVTVGCPPAVPIVVSGEMIDESHIALFKYYGIETCAVLRAPNASNNAWFSREKRRKPYCTV